VYQEYLIVPSLSVVPALARVLQHCAVSDPKYKVIVFFPTARFTGYMASLLGDASAGGWGLNVLEIHSRKSQSARNKAAEAFRVGTGLFLFSSDVSARGMDFPDVTRVIQVRSGHTR
jgi:ATP-dependent RNA helicase MSS116